VRSPRTPLNPTNFNLNTSFPTFYSIFGFFSFCPIGPLLDPIIGPLLIPKSQSATPAPYKNYGASPVPVSGWEIAPWKSKPVPATTIRRQGEALGYSPLPCPWRQSLKYVRWKDVHHRTCHHDFLLGWRPRVPNCYQIGGKTYPKLTFEFPN